MSTKPKTQPQSKKSLVGTSSLERRASKDSDKMHTSKTNGHASHKPPEAAQKVTNGVHRTMSLGMNGTQRKGSLHGTSTTTAAAAATTDRRRSMPEMSHSKITRKTSDHIPSIKEEHSASGAKDTRAKPKAVKKTRETLFTITVSLISADVPSKASAQEGEASLPYVPEADQTKRFLDWINKNKTSILKNLNDASQYAQNKGVLFQKLEKEKKEIALEVTCQTVEGLIRLEKQYAIGELQGLVGGAVWPEAASRSLKWDNVRLRVEVKGGKTEPCRSALTILTDTQQECYLSSSRLATSLNVVRVDLRRQLKELRTRYSQIEDKMSDLSTALRLGKPADKNSFDCMQDVVDCYRFLCMSNSVGQMLNKPLVRDFIEIVSETRIYVTDIQSRLSVMEPHMRAHKLHPGKLLSGVDQLSKSLEPTFSWVDLKAPSSGAQSLNILERSLFSGLFFYMPDLFSKMATAVEDLNDIIPDK